MFITINKGIYDTDLIMAIEPENKEQWNCGTSYYIYKIKYTFKNGEVITEEYEPHDEYTRNRKMAKLQKLLCTD